MSNRAARELKKIPKEYIRAIKALLLRLKENPFPRGYIKLKDKEFFRVRFGRVRIVYQVDYKKRTVLIFKIGLRNEKFYKKL